MSKKHKTAQQLFSEAYKLAFSRGKGDFKSAAELWKQAAIHKHVRSMFYLGACYDNGLGTRKNLRKAFNWYLLAAEAGHRDSQFNIGYFYQSGELFPVNHAIKVFWYKKAAKQGLYDAQRDLGYSYFFGEGLAKTEKRVFTGIKKHPFKVTQNPFIT